MFRAFHRLSHINALACFEKGCVLDASDAAIGTVPIGGILADSVFANDQYCLGFPNFFGKEISDLAESIACTYRER